MAIKTPFKISTILHIIIGLMIFLWAWSLYGAVNGLIIIFIVAVLKELSDLYLKLPILRNLLKNGFYDSKVGLWLEKNVFIMPRKQLENAVPLFDYKDIVATVVIPIIITIIVAIL